MNIGGDDAGARKLGELSRFGAQELAFAAEQWVKEGEDERVEGLCEIERGGDVGEGVEGGLVVQRQTAQGRRSRGFQPRFLGRRNAVLSLKAQFK